MFYDALNNEHGLKYDPFKALVVPRPIGWVSTVSNDGVPNIAPYSFFNAIADRPHYVMFSSEGIKDSLQNIIDTGEFVWSFANYELRHAMNITSATVASDLDEFALANLQAEPSRLVRPPRVAGAPAALECRAWKMIELPGGAGRSRPNYTMVIGVVVGVHIDDRYITDGLVNTGAMQPIARLGYMNYGLIGEDQVFTMDRPTVDDAGHVVPPESAPGWDGVYR